jgi:hypothetical protein
MDDHGFPSTPSFAELQRLANAQRRDSIMNRMEDRTEGTMAMVGSLRTLDKPLVEILYKTRFRHKNFSDNFLSYLVGSNGQDFSPTITDTKVSNICTRKTHKSWHKKHSSVAIIHSRVTVFEFYP